MSEIFMQILKTALASLGSIVILFGAAKGLGNKQISQLNMFDYINGITIGSIAAEMAVADERNDLFVTATALIIYALAGIALSFATIKSVISRRFFSSETILLIDNGKIYPKNLKRARLDINDLLTKARMSGYFNIAEIAYAIMEDNGEISFLQKPEFRAPSISDLNLPPQDQYLFANVIMDGNVMTKNLKHMGKDEIWLNKQLKAQGYRNAREVFLATLGTDNALTVFPANDAKDKKDYFE
ncbi:MAG: DUF421 domain-containing protein [Oscillospiraceae bacterium]